MGEGKVRVKLHMKETPRKVSHKQNITLRSKGSLEFVLCSDGLTLSHPRWVYHEGRSEDECCRPGHCLVRIHEQTQGVMPTHMGLPGSVKIAGRSQK